MICPLNPPFMIFMTSFPNCQINRPQNRLGVESVIPPTPIPTSQGGLQIRTRGARGESLRFRATGSLGIHVIFLQNVLLHQICEPENCLSLRAIILGENSFFWSNPHFALGDSWSPADFPLTPFH